MNISNFLRQTFFFSSLEDNHYKKLENIAKVLKYRKGETIFSEGEVAKGFYIIKSGKVKIYKISFEGKEHILHIFGPKEPFGEAPAFTGAKFPAHACALTQSELIYFDRELFLKLIKEIPEISIKIIALLSRRLHNFTTIIENLSLKEVPSRLAGYLLYLLEKSGDNNKIILDMPKKFLANFLGTTPETLSRIFYKMKEKGFIEMEGNKITILDQTILEEISEGILNLREV